MTFVRALALVAVLLTPAPLLAQKLDLSTIKCQEFIDSPKETIGFILMWLEGYYSDEDAPPIVDFDKMKADGGKLGGYCAKNPTTGLITAADEILGK